MTFFIQARPYLASANANEHSLVKIVCIDACAEQRKDDEARYHLDPFFHFDFAVDGSAHDSVEPDRVMDCGPGVGVFGDEADLHEEVDRVD